MVTGTVTLTSLWTDKEVKQLKKLEGWGRSWRGGEEAGGVGKRLEGWGRGWRGEEEAGGVGKRLEG